MNKVDEETLADLREYFTKLDIDGTGVLSKNDLILRAKAKLRRTSHKLGLATYKQKLLRQAKLKQRRRQNLWIRLSQDESTDLSR